MINFAHVIVDLQAGDTGKGKVAHALAKSGDYDFVIRYNGGGNAGHTIYHEGRRVVTHFIPVGVLYGIKSVIGPGCVINIAAFLREIESLKKHGVNAADYLLVDKRVHVITGEHIEEDTKDKTIGTTKTGNGPCYRDKYSRKGIRAEEISELEPFLCDVYELFHSKESVRLLFEGAQGFELDIDWGDYPWVTSSHCITGSVALNGVPVQKITKVFGVAKAYRTYVGNKEFETASPEFKKIRELGFEYGATTGRKRQVNWLDVDNLIVAANVNGVTNLIINKLDILEQVALKLFYNKELLSFDSTESFKTFISEKVKESCELVQEIKFSTTPYDI